LKFLADSMLGRLAKWLRILGFDTIYLRQPHEDSLDRLLEEERLLLTRHRATAEKYRNSLLITQDHVEGQLAQLKRELDLAPAPSAIFSRCILCNSLLTNADPEEVEDLVPEYVFYRKVDKIRYCPQCGRYFWPGTHRQSMLDQVRRWGLLPEKAQDNAVY